MILLKGSFDFYLNFDDVSSIEVKRNYLICFLKGDIERENEYPLHGDYENRMAAQEHLHKLLSYLDAHSAAFKDEVAVIDVAELKRVSRTE
jgi:hypothetical protein